jgi:hypothetical protein
MISKRVEIEEVGDVNVLHAELVGLAAIMRTARDIVIDLYALHFESNVAVFNAPIELGVSVDEVDGGNVMCDKRENFFFCFFVDKRRSVGIVVLLNERMEKIEFGKVEILQS